MQPAAKTQWNTPSVLSLPVDLAFIAAAEQNFDRDVRMRLVGEKQWEQEKETYLLDAGAIVKANKENHQPDFFDHQYIKVRGDVEATLHTERARQFLAGIDMWYAQQLLTDRIDQSFEMLKPVALAYLNIKG